ncbi:MAG: hypothetical protein J2P37_15170, partial [Ktedonobacteraceae bacterium]|nr:hypothetical protein [Ktedonobacteraceae bacterium]
MGSIYEALSGKPGPSEGDQPQEGKQGQGDSSFGLPNMVREVKAGQGEVKNEEVAGVLRQHDKQLGTLQQERAEGTKNALEN